MTDLRWVSVWGEGFVERGKSYRASQELILFYFCNLTTQWQTYLGSVSVSWMLWNLDNPP